MYNNIKSKQEDKATITKIMVDEDKCVGCYNCTIACIAVHETRSKNIYSLNVHNTDYNSRNVVSQNSDGRPTPMVCRHCDVPECVLTCVSGAMTKDEDTGIVSHNLKRCASCFMCVMSCPYGVLKADNKTGKIIIKCDMCEKEDTPACVASCPTGALYIKEVPKL